MIPKIIHYCWFGGKKKPPMLQRYIDGWREKMPDYTLCECNENNFDVGQYPYAKAAYEMGKFAFVSDVARVHVLYNHGGVYMDTDVEALKPLDRFLVHRAFSGQENNKFLVTATMGAEAFHPWIERILEYYKTQEFDSGIYTNTRIIDGISQPLVENTLEDGTKILQDGVYIYPMEYFCPIYSSTRRINKTQNTHTIHHFSGSWLKNWQT